MKDTRMASAICTQSRIILFASLVTLSQFWLDALRAQETASLPDYVIEEFGRPPAVPEGPLPEAMQSAVRVAFIDSVVQKIRGQDRKITLIESSQSQDPRIVRIISDLMHFAPATDNLKVSGAEEATWLKDEDIVFGIAENSAYRAYPRHTIEIHEMVNDTLGGRHLAIPNCTLFGTAQAYFTDNLPEGSTSRSCARRNC